MAEETENNPNQLNIELTEEVAEGTYFYKINFPYLI